uniref:Uncharacterized protein n=1 Tax=Cebus imitator TaxID=2715852 RepID=A0A2K5R6D4_CEBIM
MAGLHYNINVFRKSMNICQIKLITYVSFSPSLSIHCYRFVLYDNVYCIDSNLRNEPELMVLCTFPTFAFPHPSMFL